MEAEITPPMGTSRLVQYKKVLNIRHLTNSTFVLRFERGVMDFQPGQYVSVGPKGDINMREYSIYSPTQAPYIEILIKEVEAGYVSKKLKALKPGDLVYVEGPFGFFTLPDHGDLPLYCIGTGTGISPFHSFIQSNNSLDCLIIHGTRKAYENYDHQDYPENKIIHCTSQDTNADFHGRVSEYARLALAEGTLDSRGLFYLCGNCDMIYEVYDILTNAGVEGKNIFAEVYF